MCSALTVQCLVPLSNYKKQATAQEAVVSRGYLQEKTYLKWLTLFVAGGTLLCCALPIVLVSLGFGVAVASLNYHIPGLVFLAEHTLWTLSLSASLLIFLAWVIWRPNQTCPVDLELAAHCQKTKRWNQGAFWLSVTIWVIGFFFSVLLFPLRQLLNF